MKRKYSKIQNKCILGDPPKRKNSSSPPPRIHCSLIFLTFLGYQTITKRPEQKGIWVKWELRNGERGLLEGVRERPLGVNRKLEAIDGDRVRLASCDHERESCKRGEHAQQPQHHVTHVRATLSLTVIIISLILIKIMMIKWPRARDHHPHQRTTHCATTLHLRRSNLCLRPLRLPCPPLTHHFL